LIVGNFPFYLDGVMRIACIHQGYELYGSDRCFAESVIAMRHADPDAEIEIVLPRPGPIVALLEHAASRIVFEPIWVLRRRDVWRLATLGLARFPSAVIRAVRRFRANDLVYVSTTVVLDHLFAARWFPGRALLHVHELADGRTLAMLRRIVRWSRAAIIYNSRATQRAFALPQPPPALVIYNGIAGPPRAEPPTYDGTRPLRVLMLGRISPGKGQDVLLAALAALPAEARARLVVRIVGGAFENHVREAALHEAVGAAGLGAIVTIEPFAADTAPLYRWADIVVVPSRAPESLGRVAIEAMAHGRPPLVSGHAGLAEVVEHGRTGWHVPPGRPEALAATLRHIVETPAAWRDFAAAARARYEAAFSAEAAAAAIVSAVAAMAPRAKDERA
jgi:glycosyltransferase involved in cell wall biosynthesis